MRSYCVSAAFVVATTACAASAAAEAAQCSFTAGPFDRRAGRDPIISVSSLGEFVAYVAFSGLTSQVVVVELDEDSVAAAPIALHERVWNRALIAPRVTATDDHLVVAWNDVGGYDNWIDAAAVDPRTGHVQYTPRVLDAAIISDIAMTPAGLVAVAPLVPDHTVHVFEVSEDASSWVDIGRIGTVPWGDSGATRPRLASADEILYCLFRGVPEGSTSNVFLFRSSDEGRSWTEVRSFEFSELGYSETRIATYRKAVLLAASPYDDVALQYSADHGDHWRRLDVSPPHTDVWIYPEIAMESERHWHVLGNTDLRDGGGSIIGRAKLIRLTTEDAGMTWSAPDTLTCGLSQHFLRDPNTHTSIALARDGGIVVGWQRTWTGLDARICRRPALVELPPVELGLSTIGNPTRSRVVTFRLESPIRTTAVGRIVAPTGRILLQRELSVDRGVNRLGFDLADLASGVYFFQARLAGREASVKLVLF